MRTNFKPEQLNNPDLAQAEKIISTCVHCGLCTATCSSYILLGDERDGPRGRIYMIKDMLESGTKDSPEVRHHIDRCMSCLSCMTTCPSGVDYMHLTDIARDHIEKTDMRPLKDRIIRRFIASILPFPMRFRLALLLAVFIRPMRKIFKFIGLKEMTAMLELAPKRPFLFAKFGGGGIAKPHKQRSKRVVIMPGCVQQILRPQINDATLRLLARQGVEVILPSHNGCCGALAHNLGRREDARNAARTYIDVWYNLMRDESLDAIIMNASGCGTMVKDYGYLLRDDPAYARRAEEISNLTKDITEFLADYDQDAPQGWTSIKVAYHSSCSLQHAQEVHQEPRMLLRQAGYSVLEIPDGHICCGSAGTYNILQPELSDELRARKVKSIESVKPDVIASGNLGCISQIASGTHIPVVHTVELIDWALGGPCPEGLESLKQKVTDVVSVYRQAG